MYSIFYTIGMVAIWVINLFNGTGLGAVYKTTETAMLVATVLAVCCLGAQALYDGELEIKPKYFYTIVPLIVVVLGLLYIKGYSLMDIKAYWGFLIVYILSRSHPDHTAIRMTGICYGVLGLFILYVYGYTEILEGWNPNSIAMIGLFSFLVFSIPFFGMRDWRSFVAMPLIGISYIVLIMPTESRSCILMVIIQLAFILRLIPVRKIFSNKKGLLVLLQLPLIVALFVVLVSLFGNISGLMEWSYETFNKPLFNGRDEIWLEGFYTLQSVPLFGTGNMGVNYWHNCAITCLTATGIVGYVLWNRLLYLIVNEGRHYLEDTCVIGAMTAFFVMFGQQSVELGFFAIRPDILTYVVLGIILGRVRNLKMDGMEYHGSSR